MPNHVHLIVVPGAGSRISRAIGEAHRRYTRYINFREKWRGYLWQGRFASFPMDEVLGIRVDTPTGGGDAHCFRNAGGIVTDDAIRSAMLTSNRPRIELDYGDTALLTRIL